MRNYWPYGLAVMMVSGAALAAPAQTEPPAPPADANLIVYRAYAQPTAWMPTVKVDGVKIVALPNRHFTAVHVSPGPHKVTLSWPLLSGQSNAAMEVTVAEGERRYLEVTGVSQLSGTGPGVMYFNMGSGIADVRPEHAEAVLERCCVFKAGR